MRSSHQYPQDGVCVCSRQDTHVQAHATPQLPQAPWPSPHLTTASKNATKQIHLGTLHGPKPVNCGTRAPTSVSTCLVGAEAGGPGGRQSQCPGTAIASLSGCTPAPVAETEALLSGGEGGNMEALKWCVGSLLGSPSFVYTERQGKVTPQTGAAIRAIVNIGKQPCVCGTRSESDSQATSAYVHGLHVCTAASPDTGVPVGSTMAHSLVGFQLK